MSLSDYYHSNPDIVIANYSCLRSYPHEGRCSSSISGEQIRKPISRLFQLILKHNEKEPGGNKEMGQRHDSVAVSVSVFVLATHKTRNRTEGSIKAKKRCTVVSVVITNLSFNPRAGKDIRVHFV